MRSTSVNAREEFVNRVFNATINIRRCVVLKTRPAELAPFMFLGHALKLVSCLDKLEPTPAGRSKKREASAHRCIYTRHGLETFFVLRTITYSIAWASYSRGIRTCCCQGALSCNGASCASSDASMQQPCHRSMRLYETRSMLGPHRIATRPTSRRAC